jgi:hypothetical protein
MELESSAFDHDETIPDRFTCTGEDVSPPLTWREVPDAAQSLALICEDPDAGQRPWAHWVLYNVPPLTTKLEAAFPTGGTIEGRGVQGRNDFGDVQYGGPCPPEGETHRYIFRLYALDIELVATAGITLQQLIDRMQGHILETAELMGRYGR